MLSGELASKPVKTITPDKTIEEAAQIMTQYNIGALVLVDSKNPNKPIGIVGERDIVKATALKISPYATVDKIATMHRLVTVREDEPAEAALEKMLKHNVRRVIVVDKDGNLVGLIGIRDVVRELDKFCKK